MPPSPPVADQIVTSSELVRHFGLWQERAARAPLYIMHRGRPRFVLVSAELMQALTASHGPAALPGAIEAEALLDAVSDIVLVADADLRVVATSRSARTHFGGLTALDAQLDGIAPTALRELLNATADRVIASGRVETIDLPSPVRAGRLLTATLVPTERGVAVFAQDGTGEREQARTRATAEAAANAMAAAGGVAAATLSARGYVIDPGEALCALTRLSREALARSRFVALVDIGGRVALGDALERVLGDGAVEACDAKLLVNRSSALAVRIGLAPIRTGQAIEGASAVVVARGETLRHP